MMQQMSDDPSQTMPDRKGQLIPTAPVRDSRGLLFGSLL